MDGELVSSPLSNSSDQERGKGGKPSAPLSYSETFNKMFPYYLSIGMTERQYWDRDCMLVKFYREADKLKQDRTNFNAWLQGMYVYDAVSRVSPILRAFANKGTKPQPYVEEPYPINKEQAKQVEQRKEEAQMMKVKAAMDAFMLANNKRFEKKGSE